MATRTRPISRFALVLGGIVFIIGNVQYGIAQVIAAAAWNPPYSWRSNFISDLGNTACGPFSIRGATSYVCSPRHAVMNASFVISGISLIAGAILLWHFWPDRKLKTVALSLVIIAGAGKILVGLAPENVNAGLHVLGAFNVPLDNIGLILIGVVRFHRRPVLASTGIVFAVVGLVASILSIAGQVVSSSFNLGLGVGGMERLAGYPANLWIIVIGIVAISAATAPTTLRIPSTLRTATAKPA